MYSIFTWIKRHQIAAFFLLTFLITWGLGFSYGGFMQKGNELLFPLVSIATCGPALAGIVIFTITNTGPKVGNHRILDYIFCGYDPFCFCFFIPARIFWAGRSITDAGDFCIDNSDTGCLRDWTDPLTNSGS